MSLTLHTYRRGVAVTCAAAARAGGRDVVCLLPTGHPGEHWSPVSVRLGLVARWSGDEDRASVSSEGLPPRWQAPD